MSFLYKFPFARISFFYLLSLAFFDFGILDIQNYYCHLLGLLMVLVVLGVIFFIKYSKFGNLWIWGFFLLLVLFCTGLINRTLKDERLRKSHWIHYDNYRINSEFFLLKICENPIEKGNWIRFYAEIESRFTPNRINTTTGKILVYLPKREFERQPIMFGDRILIASKIQDISGPYNPFGFDPKSYYSDMQIYGQIKVKVNCFRRLGGLKGKGIHYWANLASTYLMQVFKDGGLKGDEFAVATALVFGLRNDMDADIVSAFSASGAMHILSVSGMHVGMIFLALEFVLKFMNRSRILKIIKWLFILITVWVYSIISGLSPSVIRASLMLTFVIFGELIGKKGSPLNTVFLSAFLLMVWDPGLINNIGFQLSFAAVAGIVVWYRDLYSIFDFRYRFFEWIWSVSAVSLTATVATLPLCLYYFNQFPNYFLLSNYLVIPISNLVVYLGISLSLLGWNSFFALVIGKLLNWTVWFLDYIVFTIEDLPGALTKGIYLFPWEVLAYYCILMVFVLWLYKRNIKTLQSFLVIFGLFQLISIVQCFSILGRSVLVFYKTNDSPIVHFLNNGGEQIVNLGGNDTISDGILKSVDGVSNRFAIRKNSKLNEPRALWNTSGWNLFPFGKARMLFVNGRVKVGKPFPIYIDVLFLGKSVWLEGLSNLNSKSVGIVVFENGMPLRRRRYFERIFESKSTKIIDLSDGGQLIYLK